MKKLVKRGTPFIVQLKGDKDIRYFLRFADRFSAGSLDQIRWCTCKTAVQKMGNAKDSEASGKRDASRF